MRFSAKGEYGVRVMVELARHFGQGPLALAEIAEHGGLPLAYLEQIVGELRQAGLVTARRGRAGGYWLSRPPAEISMGEIVRLLEGGISPMVCVPDRPQAEPTVQCVHQDYCTTRVLWLKVRDSIVATLESTTLADLVPGAIVPAPLPVRLLIPAELGATTTASDCQDFRRAAPVRRSGAAG